MFDDWEQLKRTVEDLTEKKARAEGGLAELLTRLRKEFGITEDQLDRLLEEKQEEERKLARKVTAKTDEFRKKLEGKL